jgi:hypothetical protein
MRENTPGPGTLFRWTAERAVVWLPSVDLLREMNARWVIARDILVDRKRQMPGSEVVKRTEGLFQTLEGIYPETAAIEPIQKIDTLTKSPYELYLERVATGWKIGERSPEGTIISEAVILRNGSTSLTLDFEAEQFQRLRANPGIQAAVNCPRATIKVFSLLAAGFIARDNSLLNVTSTRR